ncbi:MAG: hypothetical protein KAR38_04705, partial [Calditrichia bacterium]|nr:hypothetical protein [Calditrichia bacterium]
NDITSNSNFKISFNQTKGTARIKEVLKNVFSGVSCEGKLIRLIGRSDSGEELHFKIGENIDYYGKLKYDDYVDQLPDNKWLDYLNCLALKNLIYDMSSFVETFGSPPNIDTWQNQKEKK